MPVSPLSAAKRLAQRSGWTLSNLELQKLLYIAHMYYMGKTGKPLVKGAFEAWDYGPVHPDVYHKAKIYGSSPVGDIFRSAPDVEAGEEQKILDETVDKLSNASPGKLVAITHWKDGAWAKHYAPGKRGTIIPQEDILKEYDDRVRNARMQKRTS